MNKKYFNYLFALGVGLCLGYIIHPTPKADIITERYTDTIRIPQPMPAQVDTFYQKVYVKAPTETILTHDTVKIHDSIYVVLPFERKVYGDSTYRAVISGYKPNLDSFEVYNKNTTVYVKEQPKIISPYVTGGVGLKGSISVGGGLLIREKHGIGAEWHFKNQELNIKYTYFL